jgi:dimethylhistidine N-methyltransferase
MTDLEGLGDAEVRALHDWTPTRERMLREVLEGLQRTEKSIPSKLLYDARGSELFEQICELDEYYLTRAELSIMERHAPEMTRCFGPGCLLIEYGSGSGRKTRLLLDHLEEPCAYVPIDISREALRQSVERLAPLYPTLRVLPVCADYTGRYEIPPVAPAPARRVVYFPGSTIGNFTPEEALEFMKHVAEIGGPSVGLLIGVDLEKDPARLEAAYDDTSCVTAAFELNVLARINRELGADFRLERFSYDSWYNPSLHRIEMYLVSEEAQKVRIEGVEIPLERGERIQTEYAYKYTLQSFARLAGLVGLKVEEIWTDPEDLFSVQHLTPE